MEDLCVKELAIMTSGWSDGRDDFLGVVGTVDGRVVDSGIVEYGTLVCTRSSLDLNGLNCLMGCLSG